MRETLRVCVLAGIAVCLGACSSTGSTGGNGIGGSGGNGSGANGGNNDGGGGNNGGGGGGMGGDMGLPPGTTMMRLVSSDYSIPSGNEFYQCQQVTLPNDIYVVKIIPISPLGVHHEVLAIDPSNKADGKTVCQAIGTNWTPLFASGVGSPSLTMPDKVALKVAAGQHIVLNLHLFNATPSTITGTAALDVVVANDGAGYQLAGVPFVGNITFTVGPGMTVNGQCTVSNPTSYFAVFPHMHTTGKHMKVWTESTSGGSTTVWDNDYLFNEQKFGEYPNWMGPAKIDLNQGDKIKVTCTYGANGIGKQFGESTNDEMCFAISYVYPAIATTFNTPFCIN
jgi:hypothetical protein